MADGRAEGPAPAAASGGCATEPRAPASRLTWRRASPRAGKVRLPVFKGRGGLVKGVDPLSNKALLEAVGDDA